MVFGDKKVSWIPESYVGICDFLPVQASRCHATTHVLYVTVHKKCTQISMIIPYQSFGKTIPVPTVARVHFLSSKIWYNTRCAWAGGTSCAVVSVFGSGRK